MNFSRDEGSVREIADGNECQNQPLIPTIRSVKSHIITGVGSWTTTGTTARGEASRECTTKCFRHCTKLVGQLRYNSRDFGIVLVLNEVGWIGGDVLESSCQLWILNVTQIRTLSIISRDGDQSQLLCQIAEATG